jgi:hypothetical protein
MHHCIRTVSGKSTLDLLPICEFSFNEIRPRINCAPVAFTQVVENGNLMSLIQQEFGANAPDIARTANDKDFHWRRKCRVIRPKSKATRQMTTAHRTLLMMACR